MIMENPSIIMERESSCRMLRRGDAERRGDHLRNERPARYLDERAVDQGRDESGRS